MRRDRRQDARPGPVKMYRVPPARAWWPAVGPRLDRRVRRHLRCCASLIAFALLALCVGACPGKTFMRGKYTPSCTAKTGASLPWFSRDCFKQIICVTEPFWISSSYSNLSKEPYSTDDQDCRANGSYRKFARKPTVVKPTRPPSDEEQGENSAHRSCPPRNVEILDSRLFHDA